MGAAKKATKKEGNAQRLLVNNVTKEHVVAVELAGGLVGVVPVVVRSADFVTANYTEVPE